MVLYVGYIEYEIVFLKSDEKEITQRKIFTMGLKKQKRDHRSAIKTFQPHPGFSKSVLTLAAQLALLHTCIHSFIKDEDAFFHSRALGGLCGS